MKRFFLVVLMLIGSTVLGVFLFSKPGCACGNIFPARIYNLNVHNPLRNRASERAAESFLHDQRKGKCEPSNSSLCSYALNSRTVLDWRLVAREESKNHVVLYYRVKDRDPNEFWGQAEIEVERTDKVWHVTGYEAIY
jgi:hypothetical protein